MSEKKIIEIIKKYIKSKKFDKKASLSNIKNWDSLTHLNILFSIEKICKVKFNINEINNFKNIDEIIKSVKKKK
jgi:acyl carrier protein|tara:strand:- start:122 stop:343 length:222 start_codon:yes stop_codon:yes gene_type:complete